MINDLSVVNEGVKSLAEGVNMHKPPNRPFYWLLWKRFRSGTIEENCPQTDRSAMRNIAHVHPMRCKLHLVPGLTSSGVEIQSYKRWNVQTRSLSVVSQDGDL